MSFQISAPYPSPSTTIIMPSPKFTDSKGREQKVDVKLSMDGTETYSYVKSSERESLSFPFELARMKALELREFFRVFYRAPLLLTDHQGQQWEASLTSFPIKQVAAAVAQGWPGGEMVEVELTFSGKRL